MGRTRGRSRFPGASGLARPHRDADSLLAGAATPSSPLLTNTSMLPPDEEEDNDVNDDSAAEGEESGNAPDGTPDRGSSEGPVRRSTFAGKENRTAIPRLVKYHICRKAQETPSLSQNQLVAWARESFGLDIHRTTINKILKRKERYTEINEATAHMKKTRTVKFPAFESALTNWIIARAGSMANADAVPDAELLEKAKDEALRQNIPLLESGLKNADGRPGLVLSKGWLSSFKKRNRFGVLNSGIGLGLNVTPSTQITQGQNSAESAGQLSAAAGGSSGGLTSSTTAAQHAAAAVAAVAAVAAAATLSSSNNAPVQHNGNSFGLNRRVNGESAAPSTASPRNSLTSGIPQPQPQHTSQRDLSVHRAMVPYVGPSHHQEQERSLQQPLSPLFQVPQQVQSQNSAILLHHQHVHRHQPSSDQHPSQPLAQYPPQHGLLRPGSTSGVPQLAAEIQRALSNPGLAGLNSHHNLFASLPGSSSSRMHNFSSAAAASVAASQIGSDAQDAGDRMDPLDDLEPPSDAEFWLGSVSRSRARLCVDSLWRFSMTPRPGIPPEVYAGLQASVMELDRHFQRLDRYIRLQRQRERGQVMFGGL